MLEINFIGRKAQIETDFQFSLLELQMNRQLLHRNGVDNQNRGLYIFFNSDNEVLYIGWATYLLDRIGQHLIQKNRKVWADKVDRIEVIFAESFPVVRYIARKRLRLDFEDIEYFLIHVMNPIYNKQKSDPKITEITTRMEKDDLIKKKIIRQLDKAITLLKSIEDKDLKKFEGEEREEAKFAFNTLQELINDKILKF